MKIVSFIVTIQEPSDLLDLLKNHRRGSTATAKQHSVKPKEKQRRSWGPDDTWSSRFVTKQTFQRSISKDQQRSSEEDKENRKEVDSKKPPSKKSKHSKKTYKHANTESVVNLRKCQPLGGFHARGNNIRNKSGDDGCDGNDEDIALRLHDDRKLSQKRRELMKMMSWVCDEGYDYIHSEQVKNLSEAEIFLDVMLSSAVPVQMTLKVNSPTDINITYQFLPTFKEEYMVLNISKTHCMVMRAF